MISVAEACLGEKFTGDPLIVGTSGRYEFRNKGIDVFIESLKQLAASDRLRRRGAGLHHRAGRQPRPAPRTCRLIWPTRRSPSTAGQYKHSTHYLENADVGPHRERAEEQQPHRSRIEGEGDLRPHVPQQGRRHLPQGLLRTARAAWTSRFSPPTTSRGATPRWSRWPSPSRRSPRRWPGSVIWVDQAARARRRGGHSAATTTTTRRSRRRSPSTLLRFSLLDEKHVNEQRTSAYEISLKRRSGSTSSRPTSRPTPRRSRVRSSAPTAPCSTRRTPTTEQINFVRQQLFAEKPVWNRMMVDKTLPKRLHALEELSRNLWWCWNPGARDLFESIDHALWAECERNPIALPRQNERGAHEGT